MTRVIVIRFAEDRGDGNRRERVMSVSVTMTAADLQRLPADERLELFDGVPDPMTLVNWKHVRTVDRVGRPLGNYVTERRLGVVGSEGGFLLSRDPDTVLAPDLVFIRIDRLPSEDDEGFVTVVPDLFVEVMSPRDTAPKLDDKVQRYLAAGVRLVWVVNARRRSVTEYAPDRTARIFVAGETLSGGAVVPGFLLPVADIFAVP